MVLILSPPFAEKEPPPLSLPPLRGSGLPLPGDTLSLDPNAGILCLPPSCPLTPDLQAAPPCPWHRPSPSPGSEPPHPRPPMTPFPAPSSAPLTLWPHVGCSSPSPIRPELMVPSSLLLGACLPGVLSWLSLPASAPGPCPSRPFPGLCFPFRPLSLPLAASCCGGHCLLQSPSALFPWSCCLPLAASLPASSPCLPSPPTSPRGQPSSS